MLTQATLKEHLHYDVETGIFTWRKCNKNRIKINSQAGWFNQGYWSIRINGRNYQAHRLAWLYIHGEFPENYIDHINNNKCDNRIDNLRQANNQENTRNSRLSKKNKSGYKGVSWHKHTEKWIATIRIDYKQIHLGLFTDPKIAYEAYCKKAKEEFGEFFNEG